MFGRASWALAPLLVLVSLAAAAGGETEAEACQQDGDLSSLMQADHRVRLAEKREDFRAVDSKLTVSSADSNKRSSESPSRSVTSLLSMSAATAVIVGPEAAAAVAAATSSPVSREGSASLPLRMAVSLSQKSTDVAQSFTDIIDSRMKTQEGKVSIAAFGLVIVAIFATMVAAALWQGNPDGSPPTSNQRRIQQPSAASSLFDLHSSEHTQGRCPGVPKTLSPRGMGQGAQPHQSRQTPMGSAGQHLTSMPHPHQQQQLKESHFSSQQPQHAAARTSSFGVRSEFGTLSGNLVLPGVESRFMVSLDDLSMAGPNDMVPIIAGSGMPLLSMKISGDGSRVELCVPSTGDPPRCSIEKPKSQGAPFVVYHKNEPFAEFRNIRAKPHYTEVTIEGQRAMMIEGTSSNREFKLSTTPSPTGSAGKQVGLARVIPPGHDRHPGHSTLQVNTQYLEIRALPNNDALLVLSVILGLTVFVGME